MAYIDELRRANEQRKKREQQSRIEARNSVREVKKPQQTVNRPQTNTFLGNTAQKARNAVQSAFSDAADQLQRSTQKPVTANPAKPDATTEKKTLTDEQKQRVSELKARHVAPRRERVQTLASDKAAEKIRSGAEVTEREREIAGIKNPTMRVAGYSWSNKKTEDMSYADKIAYYEADKENLPEDFLDVLEEERRTPSSRHYDPYSLKTSNNDEARELFGRDTFDQAFFDENTGYADILQWNSNRTSPLAPTKKGERGTEEYAKAYKWWHMLKDEQFTQSAEKEMSDLRSDIAERAKRGDGEEEILNSIFEDEEQFKDAYPSLYSMRGAKDNYTYKLLNRPVYAGDDSIRAIVSAAVRGEDVSENKDYVGEHINYLKQQNAYTAGEHYIDRIPGKRESVQPGQTGVSENNQNETPSVAARNEDGTFWKNAKSIGKSGFNAILTAGEKAVSFASDTFTGISDNLSGQNSTTYLGSVVLPGMTEKEMRMSVDLGVATKADVSAETERMKAEQTLPEESGMVPGMVVPQGNADYSGMTFKELNQYSAKLTKAYSALEEKYNAPFGEELKQAIENRITDLNMSMRSYPSQATMDELKAAEADLASLGKLDTAIKDVRTGIEAVRPRTEEELAQERLDSATDALKAKTGGAYSGGQYGLGEIITVDPDTGISRADFNTAYTALRGYSGQFTNKAELAQMVESVVNGTMTAQEFQMECLNKTQANMESGGVSWMAYQNLGVEEQAHARAEKAQYLSTQKTGYETFVSMLENPSVVEGLDAMKIKTAALDAGEGDWTEEIQAYRDNPELFDARIDALGELFSQNPNAYSFWRLFGMPTNREEAESANEWLDAYADLEKNGFGMGDLIMDAATDGQWNSWNADVEKGVGFHGIIASGVKMGLNNYLIKFPEAALWCVNTMDEVKRWMSGASELEKSQAADQLQQKIRDMQFYNTAEMQYLMDNGTSLDYAVAPIVGEAVRMGLNVTEGKVLGELTACMNLSKADKLVHALPSSASVFGSEYTEQYEKTGEHWNATLYGGLMSAIELATESKPIDNFITEIFGDASKGLASKGLKSVSQTIGQGAMDWVGNTVLNANAEGIQEVLSGLGGSAVDALMNGEEFNYDTALEDYWGGFSVSLLMGAMALPNYAKSTAYVAGMVKNNRAMTTADWQLLTNLYLSDLSDPDILRAIEDGRDASDYVDVETAIGAEETKYAPEIKNVIDQSDKAIEKLSSDLASVQDKINSEFSGIQSDMDNMADIAVRVASGEVDAEEGNRQIESLDKSSDEKQNIIDSLKKQYTGIKREIDSETQSKETNLRQIMSDIRARVSETVYAELDNVNVMIDEIRSLASDKSDNGQPSVENVERIRELVRQVGQTHFKSWIWQKTDAPRVLSETEAQGTAANVMNDFNFYDLDESAAGYEEYQDAPDAARNEFSEPYVNAQNPEARQAQYAAQNKAVNPDSYAQNVQTEAVQTGTQSNYTNEAATERDTGNRIPEPGDSSEPLSGYRLSLAPQSSQTAAQGNAVPNGGSGAIDKTVTRASAIGKKLTNTLGVFRSSKYKPSVIRSGGKALGVYDAHSKYVSTGPEQDISSLAHEVGHFLFDRAGVFDGNKPKAEYSAMIQRMRNNLPQSFVQAYINEGLAQDLDQEAAAEFVRLMLTDRNAAANFASPEDVRWFEDNVLQGRKEQKAFYRARAEINNLMSASGVERTKAMITYGDDRKDNRRFWEKTFTQIFDTAHPFMRFDAAARKAGYDNRNPDNRVYTLMSNIKYATDVAGNLISRELTDPDGNYLLPSMTDTVSRYIKHKDTESFDAYLLLLNDIDRQKQEKPIFPNQTAEESRAQAERLAKEHPEFVPAQKALLNWWDTFVDTWVVAPNIVPNAQQKYAKFRAIYPNYAPSYRSFEDTEDIFREVFSDRAKGSDLAIKSPIEGFARRVYRIVSNTEKALAMRKFHDVFQATPGLSDYAKEIETPSAEDAAQRIDIAKAVDRDGNVHYYQITDPIMNDVLNGDPKDIPGVLLAFGKITGTFKSLTTINSPFFGVSNAFRDMIESFVKGSSYTPFDFAYDWISSLAMIGYDKFAGSAAGQKIGLKQASKKLDRYYAQGGGDTSVGADGNEAGVSELEHAMYSQYMRDEFKRIFSRKPNGGIKAFAASARETGRAIASVVTAINNTVETTSRFSEFRRQLRKKGENAVSDAAAFRAAMEVTTDFRRSGNSRVLKEAGQLFAFMNAGLQGSYGVYRMADEAKYNPKQFAFRASKAMTMFAIVPIMLRAFIKRDEEDEKMYQLTAENVRSDNYLIPKRWLGMNESRDYFIKIPKPQGLLTALGDSFAQATIAAIDNEDGWEAFFRYDMGDLASGIETQMGDALNPFASPVWAPAVQLMMNTTWYGSPIEPQWMKDKNLSKELMYNENTSKVGVWLANLPGIRGNLSPIQVDYFINQAFGVVGDVALSDIGDTFVKRLQGEARPSEVFKTSAGVVGEMFVSRVSTDPTAASDITSDMYDMTDWFDGIVNDSKEGSTARLNRHLSQTEAREAVKIAEKWTKKGGVLYEAQKKTSKYYDEIDKVENGHDPEDVKAAKIKQIRLDMLAVNAQAVRYCEEYRKKYTLGTPSDYARLVKNK